MNAVQNLPVRDVADSIEIRQLSDSASIESSQALRYEVWSAAGAVLRGEGTGKIADALDGSSFHWGAYANGRLVASARLSIHSEIEDAPDGFLFTAFPTPLPVASINRMVVLPEYRRLGIARGIDALRIQKARENRCRTIIAGPVKENATIARLKSYGFIFIGVNGIASWSDTPITAAYLPLNDDPDELSVSSSGG